MSADESIAVFRLMFYCFLLLRCCYVALRAENRSSTLVKIEEILWKQEQEARLRMTESGEAPSGRELSPKATEGECIV